MKRKLLSWTMLNVMVCTLLIGVAVSATMADENVVYSYGFEEKEGYFANGADYVSEQEAEIGIRPHSGDKYLTLPNMNSYYVLSFTPPEGGDDANYILSFYAKTSLGQSLFVETIPLVKEADKDEVSWATYRKENNLPYIDDGEGKSQLVTGYAVENGSDWLENRLEFRVPKGCNLVKIYFNTQFAKSTWLNRTYESYVEKADPYRAVDTITIRKTELNYVRNGNFDCIAYKEDGTVTMPHATWTIEYAEVKKDSDHNAYLYWNQPDGASDYSKAEQRMYLYKGEYLLSMDVTMKDSRGTQIVYFYKSEPESAACNLTDNSTLALIKADTTSGNKEFSYSTYFTVTEDGEFVLRMGGTRYYPGEFTFDNIKIVPIEYASIAFGTISHSATDADEEGPGDFHFEYTPVTKLEAGEKIRPFGHAGINSGVKKAQVITAVYKILPSGQKALLEMFVDDAEAGKMFTGSEFTVPEIGDGESVLVKTILFESATGLKPLGDDFILK